MDVPSLNDGPNVSLFRRRGFENSAASRSRFYETSTRFLALTTIPVLLVLLVRMLLGKDVVSTGIIGLVLAFPIAIGLTYQSLLSTVARIAIASGAASIENGIDCLAKGPRRQRDWSRVLDIRDQRDTFQATIGLDAYTFDRAHWSDFDGLRDALLKISTSRGGDES